MKYVNEIDFKNHLKSNLNSIQINKNSNSFNYFSMTNANQIPTAT